MGRVLFALEESQHIADRNLVWRPQEEIPTLMAAFGIDKSAALQLTEDHLQEPQRNGLCRGDFRYLHGAVALEFGQLQDGSQRVLLALLGSNHLHSLPAELADMFLDYFDRDEC